MTIFRNRWWIVAACTMGLIASGGPVNIFSFGVFLRPVTDDLHIGRGMLAGAMLATNWISAVSGPFVGWVLDRWGARRVLLVGAVAFAIGTALQSFLTASVGVIYMLFALKVLSSVGVSPTTFSFVVTKWFDARRGLALGVAMAGVGLGTTLIPPAAAWLIDNYGWRAAYVALGRGHHRVRRTAGAPHPPRAERERAGGAARSRARAAPRPDLGPGADGAGASGA